MRSALPDERKNTGDLRGNQKTQKKSKVQSIAHTSRTKEAGPVSLRLNRRTAMQGEPYSENVAQLACRSRKRRPRKSREKKAVRRGKKKGIPLV